MNRELNVFTLRMLRDQCHAEHLDTEAEALEAAISALEQPELIEQGAYVRGFEQGRTQGMLDAKLQPTCNKLATDCISRQAAIDVASGYCHPANVVKELAKLPSAQPDLDSAYTEGYTAAESKYRKMWDEMQAAQPEPQWIPCSERLPEEDGDYWVTVDPRYVPPQYKSTDIILWSNGKWMMADYFVIDGEGRKMPEYKAVEVDIPIIAWMPLPEPWRGEES